VIVITGTTRGLGRALALELARRGHTIAGCGRSSRGIGDLREALPKPHRFAEVDVSEWEQVEAWAEEVIEELGPPDLLINNAAIMLDPAPLWEIEPSQFEQILEVNVLGIHHVVRAFVPAMIRRGSGVIVNYSSGWGRSTDANVAPYCATKFAVEGLTKALAQELPQGMAAVALSPGMINTDMLRQCWGANAANYISPEKWAPRAADTILRLGPKDNGRSLSVRS